MRERYRQTNAGWGESGAPGRSKLIAQWPDAGPLRRPVRGKACFRALPQVAALARDRGGLAHDSVGGAAYTQGMSCGRNRDDLDSLSAVSRGFPLRERYLRVLHSLRDDIASADSLWIDSAIAFGSFVRVFEDGGEGRFVRPRNGLELLIITREQDLYKAHKALGDKVFGPLLLKFGLLPKYHVWTHREAVAAKRKQHPIWKKAVEAGITLYGRTLNDITAAGAASDLS